MNFPIRDFLSYSALENGLSVFLSCSSQYIRDPTTKTRPFFRTLSQSTHGVLRKSQAPIQGLLKGALQGMRKEGSTRLLLTESWWSILRTGRQLRKHHQQHGFCNCWSLLKPHFPSLIIITSEFSHPYSHIRNGC